MKKSNLLGATGIVFGLLFITTGAHSASVFSDFSSITTGSNSSGSLTNNGLTVSFSGSIDDVFSDANNGSSNALLVRGGNTFQLNFSSAISSITFELDAMHLVQDDGLIASLGVWSTSVASLTISGQEIFSTASVINPGGSGIDDDLLATLSFNSQITSLSLSAIGSDAFGIDSISVSAVPAPAAVWLFGLGLLGLFGVVKQKTKKA